MALKALIYVVLFLSIAQVAMSVSSSSNESGLAILDKMLIMNKAYKEQLQQPLEDACACHCHCKMGDEEEQKEDEEEDENQWFVKVLGETLAEKVWIEDLINDVKEISFPIKGHQNEEFAILDQLNLDEVDKIYKSLEPIVAGYTLSPSSPGIYEVLTMVAEISKGVIEVDKTIKNNEAKKKAEEEKKKAEEAKKKARYDARKAKAADKAKLTKSKSMGAKDSSDNSTSIPASLPRSKSLPNQPSLPRSKSSLKRTPSAPKAPKSLPA